MSIILGLISSIKRFMKRRQQTAFLKTIFDPGAVDAFGGDPVQLIASRIGQRHASALSTHSSDGLYDERALKAWIDRLQTLEKTYGVLTLEERIRFFDQHQIDDLLSFYPPFIRLFGWDVFYRTASNYGGENTLNVLRLMQEGFESEDIDAFVHRLGKCGARVGLWYFRTFCGTSQKLTAHLDSIFNPELVNYFNEEWIEAIYKSDFKYVSRQLAADSNDLTGIKAQDQYISELLNRTKALVEAGGFATDMSYRGAHLLLLYFVYHYADKVDFTPAMHYLRDHEPECDMARLQCACTWCANLGWEVTSKVLQHKFWPEATMGQLRASLGEPDETKRSGIKVIYDTWIYRGSDKSSPRTVVFRNGKLVEWK
ncbi:hypothetical protein [Sutterella sp.]|uniref:hypothetical protein n=1 Tax=Sutterella sp. TaxID=1981025 RepID=UPI003FD7346F